MLGHRVTSLILSILLINMSLGTATAGMLGNTAVLMQSEQAVERQALLDQLQRSEVREQLMAMGVQPEAVESRIRQLSPGEVTQLNQQIADAPAGSGLVELVLLLFVLFVITDMLGATDIFPFVNRIN
ncbi:hypothetical protein MNBD_GAMMA15-400 [hydrothermal vent metagenome]|uniref:PA2779 family protein n=1 Tax=hydrothermal vent metagenome TaxID=652676 RepID=A0A3B0XZF7_9ZZZZ